jgi:translation initiation factor IF-2
LPEQVRVRIIHTSVGAVTDGDVKPGIPTHAMVVAFNVRVEKAGQNLIQAHKMKVVESKIIYELTQQIEKEIKRLSRIEARGDLEILATFGKKGPREQIIGGRVVSGVIENQTTLEIQRDGKDFGEAKIVNLQQGKEDAQEVQEGNECGLLVTADEEIRKGDHLLLY